MTIREQQQRPGLQGFGWSLQDRVRVLPEGEEVPVGAEVVADGTVLHGWSVVSVVAAVAPAPAPVGVVVEENK